MNAPKTGATHRYIGEHINVMAACHDADIEPTVACAPVGCQVAKLYDYRGKKLEIRIRALEAARTLTDAAWARGRKMRRIAIRQTVSTSP